MTSHYLRFLSLPTWIAVLVMPLLIAPATAQTTPLVSSGGDTLKMYWTDTVTDKIQRANLAGSNVEDLITTGLRDPVGLALDVGGGKMYWVDWGTDKIQRADLDGSNVEDLITTGLTNPARIALDVGGGKMYWTDFGTDKIQRADLDGSNVEDLITTGLRDPVGIALDVGGGKMYWTDLGSGTSKIQRADLDGSNVEDLIATGLGNPSGLALDVGGGKMYWTDVTTSKIQRADLSGSNVEDLITTGLSQPYGIALDVGGGKMYWTDLGTAKIQRADLSGSNVEDLITTGLSRPSGLALDKPTVTLALSPSSISEAGGVATVSAKLSHRSAAATTITVRPVTGAYTVGSDSTITIAAGDTTNASDTVVITAVNNTTDAPDKRLGVSGTVAGDDVASMASGTLTITDDEASPDVTLMLSPSSISEAGGVSTVSAVLSRPSSEATTITVRPLANAYTVGQDSTITIAAGDTTNASDTVVITAVNNTTDAPNNDVTVSGVARNDQGVGSVTGAALTLDDDEASPDVTLMLSPTSISEAGGVATVSATLSRPSSEATTITVRPLANAYTVGQDSTIAIAAGQTANTSDTVVVTAVDNAQYELDRAVTVSGVASNDHGVGRVTGAALTLENDDASKMYWTDAGTDKIQRASLNGSQVEDLITAELESSWGIALDVGGGKMYWTDRDANKIQRADLNGSNVEDLITTGLSSPRGIALDVGGGKMYWVDAGTDKIQRADLDGSNVEDLIATGLSSPRGIALDVGGGKMYWTDAGTDKIQRADLDGSNVEDLITTGLSSPRGIALDVGGGKMYWTDDGRNRIQRADLDGSNVEDLITTGLRDPVGIALDVGGGKMYWTDRDANKIQRADLNGSNVEDLITTGLDNPVGIALFQPTVILALSPTSISEAGGVSTVSATLSRPSSAATTITVRPVANAYTVGQDSTITIAAGDTTNASDTVAITAVDNGQYEVTRAVTVSGVASNDQDVGNVTGAALTLEDDDAPKMYWMDADTDKIQRVNIDGSYVEDLITTGLDGPYSIALDVGGGKMYWTDTTTDKIQRADLDGSNVEDLITTGLGDPSGIALDVGRGKMYWMDASTNKIQRADLNGSNVEDLITAGLRYSGGIALDVGGGKMYWTDRAAANIQRADLDGSNVEDLITTGLDGPFGIALDVGRGKMYWTDIVTDKIQRADLDGSNVEDLITTGLGNPFGIALDVGRGKMYWTDNVTNKIQRADLDGSNVEDLITTGLTTPNGIALDKPTVTLALSPTSISEAGGVATVSAKLSHLSRDATTITVRPVTGAYTVGSDSTITIAAGDTTNASDTVVITAVNNTTDAPDKRLGVSGTVAGDDVASLASGTLTITDDEAAPTVTLMLSPSSISEAGGVSTVSATLSRPSSEATTITVRPVTGAYTVGQDSTIAIAAGQTANTSDTVVVTAVDNTQDEVNRAVTVSGVARNAQGAGSVTGATLTLTDDDATPTLSIASASVDEGATGETPSLEFIVSLSAASGKVVTVGYADATSGTATSGTDYTAITAGTLTFAAGVTRNTIAVSVTGDNTAEPNETVSVTLSNPVNATFTGGSATLTSSGTITDDDTTPRLSISSPTVAEGSGSSSLEFIVTLSVASGQQVTVDYEDAGTGTATSGDDYTAITAGTLTLAAGVTSDTLAVGVLADALDEENETVVVELSNPVNATINTATGTGTITDDDDEPTLSIASASVAEGTTGATPSLEFIVTLSAASGRQVTVDYEDAGTGTATSGTDYTAITAGTLTLAAGVTSDTLAVTVLGDALDEDDETVIVTLSSASNAAISTATGTGTITDDDAPPTLSIASASVTEGDAGETPSLEFIVSLSAASGKVVTVGYADATSGTATSDTDYTAITAGTLTFASGVTRDTLAVSVTGDDTAESDETVIVTLSNPSNATLSGGGTTLTGTGTITNDDGVPRLSISSPTVAEGSGSSSLEFIVMLSVASSQQVTVGYEDAGTGTATSGDDYTAITAGTLTFAAGVTRDTLAVTVLADALDEDDETVIVTLSSASNAAISTATGTGTITDDDGEPTVTLSLSASTISENGGVSTVSATLSHPSSAITTITVSAAPVSPATASDFTLSSADTLIIAASETTSTGTVTITAVDNDDRAGDKTVTVSATANNAQGITAPEPVTLTITDDEPSANLDVDGDGRVRLFSDIILVIRYVLFFREEALLRGNVIEQQATRTTAQQIEPYLDILVNQNILDVDGDGDVRLFSDIILIIRYVLFFRNEALIRGNVIEQSATRTTAQQIEPFIRSLYPDSHFE